MKYDRTVIAYHGCDAETAEHLFRGEPFKKSWNDYDWLGEGIYFWEYGASIALRLDRTPLRSTCPQARLHHDLWSSDTVIASRAGSIPVPVHVTPRPGRNEPCWCGSTKKYKKCDLEADDEARAAGAAGPR